MGGKFDFSTMQDLGNGEEQQREQTAGKVLDRSSGRALRSTGIPSDLHHTLRSYTGEKFEKKKTTEVCDGGCLCIMHASAPHKGNLSTRCIRHLPWGSSSLKARCTLLIPSCAPNDIQVQDMMISRQKYGFRSTALHLQVCPPQSMVASSAELLVLGRLHCTSRCYSIFLI